jgi:hypothetical protein
LYQYQQGRNTKAMGVSPSRIDARLFVSPGRAGYVFIQADSNTLEHLKVSLQKKMKITPIR